jgi:hypothetical protein
VLGNRVLHGWIEGIDGGQPGFVCQHGLSNQLRAVSTVNRKTIMYG